jgi:hypothetical protein
MIGSIDALSIIPDPKNYTGSKMRFIGLEKQLSISYIKENQYFNKTERENALAEISEEWRKTEQSRNTAQ